MRKHNVSQLVSMSYVGGGQHDSILRPARPATPCVCMQQTEADFKCKNEWQRHVSGTRGYTIRPWGQSAITRSLECKRQDGSRNKREQVALRPQKGGEGRIWLASTAAALLTLRELKDKDKRSLTLGQLLAFTTYRKRLDSSVSNFAMVSASLVRTTTTRTEHDRGDGK